MRTALLAERLVARGHQVLWWASAFDHMRKRMLFPKDTDVEVSEGLTIKALKGTGYRRNVSVQRYLDHWIIAAKFSRLAGRAPRPGFIVASTPDHHLANEAARFAALARIPILVDIRDEWPDIFVTLAPAALRPLVKALLFWDFRKLKKTLAHADGLTSMLQPLLDRGLQRAGRPATWRDRVFFLGAERPRDCSNKPLSRAFRGLLEQLKGKFVVAFTGTFGSYYNPAVLVKAARHLNRKVGSNNRYAFVLAGHGRFYHGVLEAAEGLDNVFLPGWLSLEEISVLLSSHASVGVIPCNQVMDAFPNKAFVYLSAGLPVLSSLGGELANLFKEHRFGLCFEPNDYEGLAALIQHLGDNPGELARMSQNARAFFEERCDADRIYSAYVDHIEKVAAASQRSGQE